MRKPYHFRKLQHFAENKLCCLDVCLNFYRKVKKLHGNAELFLAQPKVQCSPYLVSILDFAYRNFNSFPQCTWAEKLAQKAQ